MPLFIARTHTLSSPNSNLHQIRKISIDFLVNFNKQQTAHYDLEMSFPLFPELIDHIFEYLYDRDLYTCLFVSHQFNEHATRLLYRYVRFVAGFTAYYSNELHKRQVFTCLAESDDDVGIQKAGIIVAKHISKTCCCSAHP